MYHSQIKQRNVGLATGKLCVSTLSSKILTSVSILAVLLYSGQMRRKTESICAISLSLLYMVPGWCIPLQPGQAKMGDKRTSSKFGWTGEAQHVGPLCAYEGGEVRIKTHLYQASAMHVLSGNSSPTCGLSDCSSCGNLKSTSKRKRKKHLNSLFFQSQAK